MSSGLYQQSLVLCGSLTLSAILLDGVDVHWVVVVSALVTSIDVYCQLLRLDVVDRGTTNGFVVHVFHRRSGHLLNRSTGPITEPHRFQRIEVIPCCSCALARYSPFYNLREFLKTNGALPVTGGRGGHYFGHGSASAVPLKPLFLKRLGDTGLPFSSGRHRNLPYLTFS